MKIPIIKNVDHDNNKIILLLSFSEQAQYFQGHFPEIAILPGFVQIHFVMFFASKYWPITSHITNIKKLRFTKIIQPESDVSLMIEYFQDNKIIFKYFTPNHPCSSGEIHLGKIAHV